MKSSRLFVRNLPFGCKEEELKEWFHDNGKGGEVTEVSDKKRRQKAMMTLKHRDSLFLDSI